MGVGGAELALQVSAAMDETSKAARAAQSLPPPPPHTQTHTLPIPLLCPSPLPVPPCEGHWP